MALSETASASSQRPSTGSSLNPSRREKLENLRQREQLKGELIHKFRDQFAHQRQGGGDGASVASAAIRQQVGDFVDNAVSVTESNIERLEQRFRRRAQGGGLTDRDSCLNSISEYTAGSAVPSLTSRFSGAVGRAGSLTARGQGPGSVGAASEPRSCRSARGTGGQPRGGSVPSGGTGRRSPTVAGAGGLSVSSGGVPAVNWSVLDKVAAQQHRQDNFRQKQRDHELKLRLKRDLELQIQDSKLQKDRELSEEEKYHRMQEQDRFHWEAQERQHHMAKEQFLLTEKSERAHRILEDVERKEGERRREKQEAQALVDRASHEVQLHQLKADEHWGKCREQAQLALVMSSDSAKMKEEAQRQLTDKDEQAIIQYERLKAQREQQVKDRRSQDTNRRGHLEQQATDRASALRRREQEALAKSLAQQSEQNELSSKRQADTQEHLIKTKFDTQAYLRAQIKEKHERKRVEEERLRQHRMLSETDARHFENEEQMRAQTKKAQHMQNRTQLELQIAKKVVPDNSSKDVMSVAEFRMNKALLDGVVDVA